jgi:hypothetical protein
MAWPGVAVMRKVPRGVPLIALAGVKHLPSGQPGAISYVHGSFDWTMGRAAMSGQKPYPSMQGYASSEAPPTVSGDIQRA